MAVSLAGRGGAGVSQDSAEYWDAFRRDVFLLLIMGYRRLVHTQYNASEEQDITGELVKAIRRITEDPESPERTMRFAIHDDPPLNDDTRFGKRRKRIDIEFELTDRRPHPRYFFEAKRLSRKAHTGTYRGPKGMGEYLAGNYARGSDEAGMLAYVQTGNQSSWADKLSDVIGKRHLGLMLTQDGQWTRVDVAPDLQHMYRTRHNRPAVGRPITLFHILLSFCREHFPDPALGD
jgi:hypothetical protein